MRHYRLVLIIGITEILIGTITLLWNFGALVFSFNSKSPGVFIFVALASLVSLSLGIGILKFRKLAYYFLLYFSSVIILSKILIFAGVIQLNGSLEITIPGAVKNIASIIYHTFVIFYFTKRGIKEIYHH